jgi:hypothetical protein
MEHRPFVFNIHGITAQSDLVIFAEVDQRQEIALWRGRQTSTSHTAQLSPTKMEISSKAI